MEIAGRKHINTNTKYGEQETNPAWKVASVSSKCMLSEGNFKTCHPVTIIIVIEIARKLSLTFRINKRIFLETTFPINTVDMMCSVGHSD